MKKGFRKAIASVLAVSMVLGSSIMSFAGDVTPSEGVSNNTTLTASGNFEGHVEKSVVNVTLPTVSADNYNFIIDPEALIQQTDGKRYPNATFDTNAKGVYFANGVNASTGKTEYGATSVMPDVINKSSVSVNVTMSIELTELNPSIKTVSESAVDVGTDANLWMAVTDGTDKEEVVGTTASMTKTIAGTAANYVVSWNEAAGEYQYVIKDNASDSSWAKAALGLTGACNTNGDWSASGLSEESTVEVTWKYEAVGASVEGGIFYDSKTNDWWFGSTTDNGFTSGIELGDVTVNGQPIKGTVKDFAGEDWVLIKWNDYKAAGYDQNETEYDFTVVVNGTTYTAHYTYE